jgi:hypothetical protein
MMFVYLKNNPHSIEKIPVNKFLSTLDYPGWGEPSEKIAHSAKDVIENPRKYQNDYKRILNANLAYPIVVANNEIIDGVHRLAKAYIQKIPEIDAYIFDKSLLDKFIIAKKTPDVWEKIHHLEAYELIDLYYQRFCIMPNTKS